MKCHENEVIYDHLKSYKNPLKAFKVLNGMCSFCVLIQSQVDAENSCAARPCCATSFRVRMRQLRSH